MKRISSKSLSARFARARSYWAARVGSASTQCSNVFRGKSISLHAWRRLFPSSTRARIDSITSCRVSGFGFSSMRLNLHSTDPERQKFA